MDTSEKIKIGYQNKFKKYGVDAKSLYWSGKGAAHQRFRQFWAEIDFNDKKVLDVGCGFGEFGKFILKRYANVEYTGVDIVPEFITEATKLVPRGKFMAANYLKDPPSLLQSFGRAGKMDGHYDVVVASGILNSNVEGRNLEYRKEGIAKLFDLTSNVLAFNMLGAHPQPENDNESNVWYADTLEILEYCMTLTRRVILRANYHSKDFTILMYRQKGDKI
ncbi:MAG TPA: class I SAM-dependent methyltransferase [Patescibacteria group bacterium]|nr:class I SAM-dependent methyltransferase [Patescibacteria group bacterium]